MVAFDNCAEWADVLGTYGKNAFTRSYSIGAKAFAYRLHCNRISLFDSYYTIATLQWKTVYRTVQVVMNRSPKVYFLLVSSCLQGNYLVGLVRTQRGPQGRPEYHDNMYFTWQAVGQHRWLDSAVFFSSTSSPSCLGSELSVGNSLLEFPS